MPRGPAAPRPASAPTQAPTRESPCAAGARLYKTASFRNDAKPAQPLVAGRGRDFPPMKRARDERDSMPLYEHVLIARQDLSNTQAEGLVEHFSTVLTDNGGTVKDSEYWGVRTLAYKINKNRKGHYALLRTDAPSAAVQEMERLARLHDDVMRVLTIKVDEHQEGPSVQMQRRDDRDGRDRGPRGDRGGDRGDRGDRGGDRGDRGGDRGDRPRFDRDDRGGDRGGERREDRV